MWYSLIDNSLLVLDVYALFLALLFLFSVMIPKISMYFNKQEFWWVLRFSILGLRFWFGFVFWIGILFWLGYTCNLDLCLLADQEVRLWGWKFFFDYFDQENKYLPGSISEAYGSSSLCASVSLVLGCWLELGFEKVFLLFVMIRFVIPITIY